jgi:23S rRNA (adenine2503-C2)-methyltransferase
VARLRAAGVATTVRDTRGQDIDGACGQLAAADSVSVPSVALGPVAGARREPASGGGQGGPYTVEPPMELGAEGDE